MEKMELLPKNLWEKLHRLTLKEAIEQKIIHTIEVVNQNDVIFQDLTDKSIHFMIFNDCRVQCSKNLIEQYSNIEVFEMLLDLIFFKFDSNGEEHFRICRPRYLNLSEEGIGVKID